MGLSTLLAQHARNLYFGGEDGTDANREIGVPREGVRPPDRVGAGRRAALQRQDGLKSLGDN